MPYKDLRAFVDRLEKEGELIRIKEEISPIFEVSAILRELGAKESPAALFENVKGYNVPVVGNLLASWKRIALALEMDKDSLLDQYQKKLSVRIPPTIVQEAPVKAMIIREDIDILGTMPVLTHHEKDASPYITQGIVFLKDAETGQRSMGLHRIQVKGRDKLGIWLSEDSPTSGRLLKNAESKGRPLDVAIAVGLEPAIFIAATSISPAPVFDKLELVGGLRGEAMEVVRGETVDLEVPANAMFVIEGKIPPMVREPDGPFGDSLGYSIPDISPVVQVTAITHQRNPIYAALQAFTLDSSLWPEGTSNRQFRQILGALIPGLKDTDFSFRSFRLVMSIEKRNEWDARHALYMALTLFQIVKYAVVVDDDVDVHDPEQVGWALAGRCQPDRDLVLVTDVRGSVIDPSIKETKLTAKLGLDATKPPDHPERFEKLAVPKEAVDKAAGILREYLQ